MATGKFVSYLRVSTDKQGRSGLGVEAQRAAVESYLNGGRWTLAAEYVESESGKRSNRPQLAKALAHAKAVGATVVFAKLDRLTRLIPALHSLENYFINMDMRPEDFDNPDAEWAPIKIDDDDLTAMKAISSLQNIIEEVRSDNGYTASHPQERDYVLEGLQGTLDKFKSSSVSAGYVRVAIERLRMLRVRFSGTLKDAMIAAATGALIEFAKKHFGDALNYLWKWPF